MAVPPDPSTLTNWEDAFQYPLPTVRALEAQLRKNIDSNRQKLRSLVGASYRDLLGTAERIIEMDEQMQMVETTLGSIGRKCNARTVGRIEENHVRMRRVVGGREEGRLRAVAMTSILQGIVRVVGRVVKGQGEALVGAKLVVLGRLLCKSVEGSGDAPGVVEELRVRLAGVRKRLLRYMERVVVRVEGGKGELVNCLCAYALVTSSTPKEVLKYFLKVRFQQLEMMTETVTDESVMQMLELYSQTLVDSRDLFPRRFGDDLGQLTKAPLLQDEQVQSVKELNLDVYNHWIPSDIKTFTPWLRHDALTSAETGEALASWTSHAQNCVLEGLQEYLKSQHNQRRIVSARQKVVRKYLSISGRMQSQNHITAICDVRQTFLERLEQVASDAGTLSNLLDDPKEENSGIKQPNLWILGPESFDLSHGAIGYRQTIIDVRHGRTDAVGTATRRLDSWTTQIHGILDLTEEMRSTRWDNDSDFAVDELDDHDDLINTLNKTDPGSVVARLRDAVSKSIDDLASKITAAGASAEHCAYCIRVWREIDRRRRALKPRLELPETKVDLSELYRSISTSAIQIPVERYIETMTMSSTRTPLTLWDGTPRLPVQPLPATFRLVTMLHRAMSGAGADLWGGEGAAEMKVVVVQALARQLQDTQFVERGTEEKGLSNGHRENEDAEPVSGGKDTGLDADAERKDNENDKDQPNHLSNGISTSHDVENNRLLQNLFELYYLQRIFTPASTISGLDTLIAKLRTDLQLDQGGDERLKKSAADYWKRTYLLFGLLAPA